MLSDCVRQEVEGPGLEVALAQHLLVAADRFQLPRLRRICERRLCETVEVRQSCRPHSNVRHAPCRCIVSMVCMAVSTGILACGAWKQACGAL